MSTKTYARNTGSMELSDNFVVLNDSEYPIREQELPFDKLCIVQQAVSGYDGRPHHTAIPEFCPKGGFDMPDAPYQPFESAIVLVNTGDEGPRSGTSDHRAGDVFEVRKKILSGGDSGDASCIGCVHCLIGPTDMITHIKADGGDGVERISSLLANIDRCINTVRDDVHNWIADTEVMLIAECAGEKFVDPEYIPDRINAWVFIETGAFVKGLPAEIMTWAPQCGAHFVARTVGRFDLAVLFKQDSLEALEAAIDDFLRGTKGGRPMAKTDTRLVLMKAARNST